MGRCSCPDAEFFRQTQVHPSQRNSVSGTVSPGRRTVYRASMGSTQDMWSTLSDKWHEAPNTAEYYVRREVRSGSDSRALIIFTGPKTLNLNRLIYSQQRRRAALRLYGHRAARGACASSVLLGTGLQVRFACVSKRCPRQPLASPQSRCCNCRQNRLSSATQAHASTCPHYWQLADSGRPPLASRMWRCAVAFQQ